MEIIFPVDREHWLALRAGDVTSTEVSAIFGTSPYSTLFELDYMKRNKITIVVDDNDRMKWGRRVQDAVATGIAEDEGWEIRAVPEYIRLPEHRIGSSFDYFIGLDGILEIKNVDALQFKEGWLIDDDGNIEAPPHIEFQLQHQLLVSGRKWGVIGCFIGGNRAVLLRRDACPKTHAAILHLTKEFWHRIDNDIVVPPDFRKDAALIAQIYGYAEPGKVLDASKNEKMLLQAVQYKELGEQIKELEGLRAEIKSRILMEIGDAEKVVGGPYSITAGTVGPTLVEAFERKGFRMFRINWKKGAKQ